MNNEALSQFIDHLAKSAPHVWHGMVAYHRAQSVTALVLTIGGYVSLGFLARIAGRMIRRGDFDGSMGGSLLLMTIIGAGVWLTSQTPERVAEVTWPERAAALDMIEQIKKVPKP